MKARLLAVTGLCCLVLTACPSASAEGCGEVPDHVVAAIEPTLETDGVLRHATARTADDRWFVSVELHEPDHDEHENGDILTFAAADETSLELVAVDEKAREHTNLPHADFRIDTDGGVESRGCTVIVRDEAEADDDDAE